MEELAQKAHIYYIENIEKISIYNKKYNYQNKEENATRKIKYNKKNKDKIKEQKRIYAIENRDTLKISKKKYRENNKDKIQSYAREYDKNRKATDPAFKFRSLISSEISDTLSKQGTTKGGHSCWKYLPYTPYELIKYVEDLFESWMNWGNHGRYDPKTWDEKDQSTWRWQLDHKKPHSEFNYETMNCQEFLDCWALTNLRPLSAKQNWEDGTNRTRHEKKGKK